MPSTFPTSIDVFDPHPPVDGFDFVMADHVGQLQDAVTAVETALGANMQNVDPPQRIHNATTAATPADADEFGYVESATFGLRKLSWGNIKTALNALYEWITVTHAATSKSTPVDADELGLVDSAASYGLKKLTWANLKATLKTYFDTQYALSLAYGLPEGMLINGYVSRTVASYNMTVAIKTLAGNTPSASDPVYVRIGNSVRAITSSLSVSRNAGTNWCSAGSAELMNLEHDYFVYIGYNAIDGVVLGFSRIPWGRTYSDFSATSNNEKYCAISTITNAVGGDEYVVIGRFNAMLTGGSSYQWSIPSPNVIVNRPITETRWLTWAPQFSANGSMTYTGVTPTTTRYKFRQRSMDVQLNASGTTGGTASNILLATLPFTASRSVVVGAVLTAGVFGGAYVTATGSLSIVKYDLSNFALGAIALNTSASMEI